MSLDIIGWILVVAGLVALWFEANGTRTGADLHHKWTARKLEELETKLDAISGKIKSET